MDRALAAPALRPADARLQRASRRVFLAGLALTALAQAGCSLFAMGGKMLFGDPIQKSSFKQVTRKSLSEPGKKVAVLCRTPESIKTEFISLDIDLLSQMSRRLKQSGVDVIQPHHVTSWIDDNGGESDDLGALAKAVGADYLIVLKVEGFSFHEENSRDLFRGRATGSVVVYERVPGDDPQALSEIYASDYNSIYPRSRPVPADKGTSESRFRRQFVEKVSEEVAQLFYDHRVSDEI